MSYKLDLVRLLNKMKLSLRIELLQFLDIRSIIHLAILSKTINRILDPNRQIIDTDDQLNIIYKHTT